MRSRKKDKRVSEAFMFNLTFRLALPGEVTSSRSNRAKRSTLIFKNSKYSARPNGSAMMVLEEAESTQG